MNEWIPKLYVLKEEVIIIQKYSVKITKIINVTFLKVI